MADKPAFDLLVPIEYKTGKGTKTRFVKFGAIWKNKEGAGFSGHVDFWPVGAGDGKRLVVLPPKDGQDSGEAFDRETGEVPPSGGGVGF